MIWNDFGRLLDDIRRHVAATKQVLQSKDDNFRRTIGFTTGGKEPVVWEASLFTIRNFLAHGRGIQASVLPGDELHAAFIRREIIRGLLVSAEGRKELARRLSIADPSLTW